MSVTKSTRDYEIFRKEKHNRAVDPVALKRLIFSIKANNMLQFRPIICNKRMEVIDGQHRLEAAKELDLEIYYQVKEDSTPEDIILLNNNQKRWTAMDYINFYIGQGNQEYIKYQEFARSKDMDVEELLYSFRDFAGARTKIKTGGLKFFNDQEKAAIEELISKYIKVRETMQRYVLGETYFLKTRKMQKAIFAILKNPEVDLEIFLKKITIKSDAIKPCADITGYYTMLRDIYNWKNNNKIGPNYLQNDGTVQGSYKEEVAETAQDKNQLSLVG